MSTLSTRVFSDPIEFGQRDISLEPVPFDRNANALDFLNGFTKDELAGIEKTIPVRPEPKLPDPVVRQVTVSGQVFEDKNLDGRPGPGDSGIPGVLISDGEKVARTGADGRFSLPFVAGEEAHLRFVVATRPTGYRPTSSYFKRIHFADTTERYEANFGFAREPLSARESFEFISTSDSQFQSPVQMLPIAKDYGQMTETARSLAFMVTAGDLTIRGSHREFDMYDRIRGASKILVYDGFGGHDGNCLDPHSTANYELRVGPPHYSWDYGGVHFIQFVTETGYLRPKAQQRQQDWIKADLAAIPSSTPVIVITHYPLPPAWFDQKKREGINILCQIAGHWHVAQRGSRAGVPVLNTAPARGHDWGSFTRAYRWFHVSPEGIRTRLRISGQYQRLRSVAPGKITYTGRQPLAVLAYDSSHLIRKVQCRLISPAGKESNPKLAPRGNWSWHGAFDADTAGTWTIELSAEDEAGSIWHRKQTFEVQPSRLEEPKVGPDFPWVLSGQPPRRVPSGPKPPLLPRWVRWTGSGHVLHASPILFEKKVYVAVTKPDIGTGESGLLCLDPGTGKKLWESPSPLGDIRGPLTADRGNIYAVTAEGWVAAFDADDGRQVWARPMRPDYKNGRPLAINQSPPVPTRHGLLVTDWQHPQFLLDYETGKQLAVLEGNVGYYAAFPAVHGNVMFTARRGGRMAVRIPDGKMLWTAEEKGRATSAPIIVDHKMYYTSSGRMKAVDATTGKLLWEAGWGHSGYSNPVPVLWDDLILANGTSLFAYDRQTGKRLWTAGPSQSPEKYARSQRQWPGGSSSPVIAGEFAFYGHDDTVLRAVDKSGNVRWEYEMGVPIKTCPAISGNLLWVHDYAGNLWCFAPVTAE